MFLQSAQWWQQELVRAFCWTLVHSCWQGLLAAVLAGLVIIGTRRATARLRYNLLVSTLVLFFAATCITFYYQAGTATAAATPATSFVAASNTTITSIPLTVIVYKEPAKPFIDSVIAGLNRYASIIVLIWSLFFIIKSIRLAGGLRYLHHIRHHKTYEPAAAWKNKMHYLSNKLGIKRSIRLLESGIIKVPVAIGYFKPVILIPAGMLINLPAEQAEAILLHELAHTLRRDYLANLLQYVIETIFFFNPALLWLSERIREERESCCDDVVIAHTYNKRAYLDALVSFHEYNTASAALAMALGKKRMHLLDRVKRLLTQENKRLNTFEKLAMLLGLLAITLFGFITRPKPVKEKPAAAVTKKEVVLNPPVRQQVQYALPKPVRVRELKPSKLFLQTITGTIPEPVVRKEIILYNDIQIKHIQFNRKKNSPKTIQTITIVDDNKNKFIIKKENGEVTELTINNEVVPKEEIPLHHSLLATIDIAMKKANDQKQNNLVRQEADRERQHEEQQQQQEEKRRQKEEKERKKDYANEEKHRKDQGDKIRDQEQIKNKILREKIQSDADSQREKFREQEQRSKLEEQKRREADKAKQMEDQSEKASEQAEREQWQLKSQGWESKNRGFLSKPRAPLFKPRAPKKPTVAANYNNTFQPDSTKVEWKKKFELQFKADSFFKVDSQKIFKLNPASPARPKRTSLLFNTYSKKEQSVVKNTTNGLVQEQTTVSIETFNRFFSSVKTKR